MIISSEFFLWTACIPQTPNSAWDGFWNKDESNLGEIDPEQLISLKLNSKHSFTHRAGMWIFCPQSLETQCRYFPSWTLLSTLWGKMGALWVALSGGRVWVRILIDANVLCVRALMCVNRQSRPRDQRGPCSDYLHGLNWTLITMLLTWCCGHCWQQTPARSPPPPSSVIIHQLLTFTRWELTSADRRLSPRVREVTAVNAVPGRKDVIYAMFMELGFIYVASW